MKLDLDRQGSGRTGLEVAERLPLEADPDLALPADVELRGSLTVDNLEGRCLVHGELAVVALLDRQLLQSLCVVVRHCGPARTLRRSPMLRTIL